MDLSAVIVVVVLSVLFFGFIGILWFGTFVYEWSRI